MSTIIIITPPPIKPPTRAAASEADGYQLHVIQGDPSRQELREILRGLLKDLRED